MKENHSGLGMFYERDSNFTRWGKEYFLEEIIFRLICKEWIRIRLKKLGSVGEVEDDKMGGSFRTKGIRLRKVDPEWEDSMFQGAKFCSIMIMTPVLIDG